MIQGLRLSHCNVFTAHAVILDVNIIIYYCEYKVLRNLTLEQWEKLLPKPVSVVPCLQALKYFHFFRPDLFKLLIFCFIFNTWNKFPSFLDMSWCFQSNWCKLDKADSLMLMKMNRLVEIFDWNIWLKYLIEILFGWLLVPLMCHGWARLRPLPRCFQTHNPPTEVPCLIKMKTNRCIFPF